MEIYRKQMDRKILEQLKDKILIYLKNRGFQKCEFIRENLDKVAGLYVENMIERDGPRMQSRGEKGQTVKENGTYKIVKKPSEIAIDKGFVLFDENDNPIGIDANVRKLIMTQLTHELIHSGTRFDGHSGIKTTKQNTGLDEGMTQMFTEKIWGYTLSPNSDSKYKDFKKIAKILDATFGEQVSIDAYFNHSDALENACNNLSQNDKFYSDMNKYLTSTYDMRKAVPKDSRDKYYQTIMQPISEKMIDLVYDKVCTEIVIPKIKTLSRDEQRKIFARHIRFS